MLIMNGKFFIRLFFLLCVFIISQNVDAQYKFYVSMSFNYNCHGNRECEELVMMTNGIIQNAISGIPISFNTKNECEAARNMTVNSLNEAKSLASQYSSYGVKLNFTVTPCSGFGGGNFVFLGPNRGSSFYSPSVADEIKNWSEDNERLQAALNPEWERSEQMAVETSDYSFDEKRKNLREGFVIDTDKPFRSLNVDETGSINTHSSDFNNVEWNFIKSTQNLPDKNVNAYKFRMFTEATSLLNNILNKSNATREELENYVNARFLFLNETYIKEKERYMGEREVLEKTYLLAKFKVDYKAILNLRYIDSTDEDYHETEAAFILVNGKTREQYYEEELKKIEKEMLDKGISQKEIDFIKSKTDSESLIKDYSSTAKDIAEGVEHLNDASLGNKVVSEILSGIADGATIGVMVNNLITIESYKIVSSAIDNHLKSLDEGFKLTENTVKQELEKNNNIDVLLKNTTINVKNKINRMNEKDGLSWASKINNIVKDIRKQIGNNSDVETIGHENITIIKCHH